ncbi:alpha-keto acid decarboxylase family protein [Ascoidea rubescens DSM 1968]|uniref:Pyruvate decarboxylase isozyme 1 n=1 Tax=Ascoidea rubescens DSM 1968 TaxID=1344418 RepID=A0A1D2VKB4_9ASCO|nr:pyruvate decarboxylase isozyme 1 [Ascoidea rubescens DSM 1968]ODV62015.1 pyruvate decarboxylase isozyme 1 [Ascoidea rubescens DSM 1968]
MSSDSPVNFNSQGSKNENDPNDNKNNVNNESFDQLINNHAYNIHDYATEFKLPEKITLGRYIFERLKQLNVTTIFGVPGDFNLTLLDKVNEVKGLRWAGNANELNASYAADGYSRIKRMGCLVTTFGVGELSAINGVAGAYAEHVGLVHIVGVPSLRSQSNHLLLHHSLGNGDFHVFEKMSKDITKSTIVLHDLNHSPGAIDEAFREAFLSQRPVYIAIPTDLVDLTLPSTYLNKKLDLSLPLNDTEAEAEFINNVFNLVKKCENPIILVDACCSRHSCVSLTRQFSDLTKFPTFVTPMGKGSVDETNPRFSGVYVGKYSPDYVKNIVESADLIFSIGSLLSDFNTGAFTYSYKTKNLVEFHSDYCKIKHAFYTNLRMEHVLKRLVTKENSSKMLEILKEKDYYSKNTTIPPYITPKLDTKKNDKELTHSFLWDHLSLILREKDIIITETGTSSFGILQTRFPSQCIGISQILYGSIGYTVGACLGASMAIEEVEPERRVLLFIGDGSLQLTVQEISTMIKWNLNPYLFVLNNRGYTIERLIHGKTEKYNDVENWDYLSILKTFNGNVEKKYETKRIATVEDFKELAKDKDFAKNDKIRLIEVILDKDDAPTNLVHQATETAATNSGTSK